MVSKGELLSRGRLLMKTPLLLPQPCANRLSWSPSFVSAIKPKGCARGIGILSDFRIIRVAKRGWHCGIMRDGSLVHAWST
jgi:hypothetical protein